MDHRHLNRNCDRISDLADVRGIRLNDLRHSFASMLVNTGYPLYEDQQALGHTDPKFTMRHSVCGGLKRS